ncbi:hypothetical protein PQQ87_08625 [Paraburkholderia nemoris]|uniref:hypothetical protein n=1 Tax=Paraburkholderia nemoris TaxID=2793076 RepID=UPI0038BB2DEA
MKKIQIRIINLDFIPGPQVDSRLREWVGDAPGVSYSDSDREAEKLARSRIENVCLVPNQEDDLSAVFWLHDELMMTRPYRTPAHAYLAAVDFVRQLEGLDGRSVKGD